MRKKDVFGGTPNTAVETTVSPPGWGCSPFRGAYAPRVWQSAPSPTASPLAIKNGEDAKMWPAKAPATTRETEQHKRGPRGGLVACAPQAKAISSLSEDLGVISAVIVTCDNVRI